MRLLDKLKAWHAGLSIKGKASIYTTLSMVGALLTAFLFIVMPGWACGLMLLLILLGLASAVLYNAFKERLEWNQKFKKR